MTRCLWLLICLTLALVAAPARGDEPPPYLETVLTTNDFDLLTIAGDPHTNVVRAGKVMAPVSDDPSLLPVIFQNVNLWPYHPEFMSNVFPNRFAGMTLDEYFILTQYRATRQYYTGALNAYEDGDGDFVYGFDVYTAREEPEMLTVDEVRELYQRIEAVFSLRPLVYAPVARMAQEAASLWPDPGFPIFYPNEAYPRPEYIPYTQATNYGRVRVMNLDQLRASEGRLSWQDILVLDDAPMDIEGVVAGVITSEPQGELSHVAIRTARRGTPNAYLDRAYEQLAELEGRLVKLTVGETELEIETDVSPAEADSWWQSHRPLLVKVHDPDPAYSALDGLLEMDVHEEHKPLAARFGGKASNLAKMFDFLPPENQVPGFAIPFSYFLQFMTTNQIVDDRLTPPALRSYSDYMSSLQSDPRFSTDAVFRAERLEHFRDHLREHGVVDPHLVDALISRIETIFGATSTMVRFRSSSNLEDSLVFNGAGLYDSTSACADDNLDNDDDGPSRCWSPQSKERTIERALKKVWASLWNFRAVEERTYFQVSPERAAMAVLVTLAFPAEAANGVAFTGDPNTPGGGNGGGWSLYVVNVQAGDASVVSPEPGVLTEKDILIMFGGEFRLFERVRRSSLVPYGEWVLSDEQLIDLAEAMALVDDRMPIDLEGHDRQDVLLDFEFKLTQAGALVFKQVRPFLITEIPLPRAEDYYRFEIPSATTLCGVFSEGRGIREEYELLTQVDLIAGVHYLPRDLQSFQLTLIDELRFGPLQSVATPLGPGRFDQLSASGSTSFSYNQDFMVESTPITIVLDGMVMDHEHPELLLDESVITHHLSATAGVDLGGQLSEGLPLNSCSYQLLPLWKLHAELEDGNTLDLDLRFQPSLAGSGPANLVKGEFTASSGPVGQEDYWHLVYAAEHHNWFETHWMLFDEPVNGHYGVALAETEWQQFRAYYLDANLDPVGEVAVTSIRRESVTPPIDHSPAHLAVIPAAAHTWGVGSTRWRSDMVVQLPPGGPVEGSCHLYFLHQDWENTWTHGTTVDLSSDSSFGLADVVRNTFGYPDAVGAIMIASDSPMVVSSRTFNDAVTGTFGQYIPAMAEENTIHGTADALLIQLSSNEAYRTNIGAVNLRDVPLHLEISLYDDQGNQVGSHPETLFAYESIQRNRVFSNAGVALDDGYAVVRSSDPEAHFATYASVVDRVSGDPILIRPTRVLAEPVFIAAAAHVTGSQNTVWRTDVELVNRGDESAQVRLDWLPGGSNNSQPISHTLTIAARRAYRLGDVVGELLATTGTGGLRITPLGGAVAVSSRTYNQADSSTFGQFIPAFDADHALGSATPGLLVQLAHSALPTIGHRTNLGCLNLGDTAIEVEVSLYTADGEEVGSSRLSLPPYGWMQLNNVFVGSGARDLINAWAVVTTPSEHATFLAYASVVDNRSGDPVFVPATQIAQEPRQE